MKILKIILATEGVAITFSAFSYLVTNGDLRGVILSHAFVWSGVICISLIFWGTE